MDEINRKRLEWLAKPNEIPPDGLGFEANVWARTIAEAAKDALRDLDSYRGIKVETSLTTGEQVVWIDGIKYARSLFEGLGLTTPVGKSFKIMSRQDGCLIITVTEDDHDWRPIETAPVEPWQAGIPSFYQFRCLGQFENGYVTEVAGYWAIKPNSKKPPALRWRDKAGVCVPKYWRPLPQPFNEPLNEKE